MGALRAPRESSSSSSEAVGGRRSRPEGDRLRLEATSLPGIPELEEGADLGRIIVDAAARASLPVSAVDVLVVAQKAVSKVEGRVRSLDRVEVSERARALAASLDKDPRLVQLALEESVEVLRAERGVLITRTRHGHVCANAGIDRSNVPGADTVSLLPEDPDRSARRLRGALGRQLGDAPGVVISDSFGRPWRLGQVEVAIGCAGLAPLEDLRGGLDAIGRELTVTVSAVADAAAAAAGLVQAKEGREAVAIVRGLERYVTEVDGPGARALVRPESEDLFR
jgi:coenzyme F420-0:L-glutamate ligase/coenzyme F420-1:gamma-L-glutamate ligase